jgi:hypothetical protein
MCSMKLAAFSRKERQFSSVEDRVNLTGLMHPDLHVQH